MVFWSITHFSSFSPQEKKFLTHTLLAGLALVLLSITSWLLLSPSAKKMALLLAALVLPYPWMKRLLLFPLYLACYFLVEAYWDFCTYPDIDFSSGRLVSLRRVLVTVLYDTVMPIKIIKMINCLGSSAVFLGYNSTFFLF